MKEVIEKIMMRFCHFMQTLSRTRFTSNLNFTGLKSGSRRFYRVAQLVLRIIERLPVVRVARDRYFIGSTDCSGLDLLQLPYLQYSCHTDARETRNVFCFRYSNNRCYYYNCCNECESTKRGEQSLWLITVREITAKLGSIVF